MKKRYFIIYPLLCVFVFIGFQKLDANDRLSFTPKEDFRGVWLTSVVNLDWPVSNEDSVEKQKADALFMLDSLKAIGINAVLFQVRSETDALYASSYDPWSHWLTGEQGRAPEPFYDPLSFMIEESHKRGMELHAWLNPYRVERKKGKYPLAENNVSRKHPEWILEFESRPGEYYTMLNPGLPEVRNYVAGVTADIISRYDVDGIHFDDYFYPYSPVTNEDSLTYLAHHNDIADIEDWRRWNVDQLMVQVYDTIQALAPHVSFGISPFAIRKNSDAGTNAFEGYYRLYADGIAWLEDRSIDYINPQLYFEIGHERADYAPLLRFWSEAAAENERHMYAGLAPYKIFPPTDWTLDQAVDQLLLNIENGNVHGNIFFRVEHLLANPKGYTDFLQNELYRCLSLTPSMPWKSQVPPPPINNLSASSDTDKEIILHWSLPEITEKEETPARYAVYRVDKSSGLFNDLAQSQNDPSRSLLNDAMQACKMIELTGLTHFSDSWPKERVAAFYLVTAISRNSIESEPQIIQVKKEESGFIFGSF